MKKIITIATFGLLALNAQAQNQANQSSAASQTTNLALSNAIEITFMGNNSAKGNNVTMEFNSPNDFANGVTSAEQQLKVKSNMDFKVSVMYDMATFMYQGTGNLSQAQVPSDALKLQVTENKTGGSVKAPFSMNEFAPIYGFNQDLLINGDRGGNNTFAVKYKCTPGFYMPAGTYTIDVVYTATQQ